MRCILALMIEKMTLTLLKHLEAGLLARTVRVLLRIHGVDAAFGLGRPRQKHLPLYVVRIFVKQTTINRLLRQVLVDLADQLEGFLRFVNFCTCCLQFIVIVLFAAATPAVFGAGQGARVLASGRRFAIVAAHFTLCQGIKGLFRFELCFRFELSRRCSIDRRQICRLNCLLTFCI